MSLEPHIDENQIIRSLSHWSRKPFIGDRQNYEPQGGSAPAIRVNTQDAYDRIMAQFPTGTIPLHGGKRNIKVIPFGD